MLEKLTNWLKELIEKLWGFFEDFMLDLFWAWLKNMLGCILFVLDHIPPPPFLSGQNIGTLLGNAGPVVGWIIQTFRIGESFSVISAAMAFYIVRRLLTLGIW